MPFQEHLFPGQVPRESYAQLEAILDLPDTGDLYVMCSGSHRSEQWLTHWRPNIRLHSCDISLLSSAIGRYCSGDPLPMRFHSKLAWLEQLVEQLGDTPLNRLAAMFLGAECRRLLGNSAAQASRLAAFVPTALNLIDEILPRVVKHVSGIRVSSFTGRDLRDHADEALARGAVVLGFPPTYGTAIYKSMAAFKTFEASVEWEPPSYREWDPRAAHEWLTDYRARGGRYVFGAEYPLPGHSPAAYFQVGRKAPVYLYTNLPTRRGSVIVSRSTRPEAVRYEVVTEADLTPQATVEIIQVPQNIMAYLKDCFYKQGLVHSPGDSNMVVLINGRLAGGFSYSLKPDTKFAPPSGATASGTAYLLADFSVGLGHRRLAKLIATLATCRAALAPVERAKVRRIVALRTTAYSDKPVSMKYRDIWTLESRRPHMSGSGQPENQLNYSSEVRTDDPAAIYQRWLARWSASDRRSGGRAR